MSTAESLEPSKDKGNKLEGFSKEFVDRIFQATEVDMNSASRIAETTEKFRRNALFCVQG